MYKQSPQVRGKTKKKEEWGSGGGSPQGSLQADSGNKQGREVVVRKDTSVL